jgi:hypothetical protein
MDQYTLVVTGLRATQSKALPLPPGKAPSRMTQKPLETVAQLVAGVEERKLPFNRRSFVQIAPLAVELPPISTVPLEK